MSMPNKESKRHVGEWKAWRKLKCHITGNDSMTTTTMAQHKRESEAELLLTKFIKHKKMQSKTLFLLVSLKSIKIQMMPPVSNTRTTMSLQKDINYLATADKSYHAVRETLISCVLPSSRLECMTKQKTILHGKKVMMLVCHIRYRFCEIQMESSTLPGNQCDPVQRR